MHSACTASASSWDDAAPMIPRPTFARRARLDTQLSRLGARGRGVTAFAAVLMLASPLACWCGDDASSDETHENSGGDAPAKPGPTPPAPARGSATRARPIPAPPELGVRDGNELAQFDDLSRLGSLALALSLIDARTRPIPADQALAERDQCDAIDLRVIAARAPKLRQLRISGCASLVHA